MEWTWKNPLREQNPNAKTVGSKGVVEAPRMVKGNTKDLRVQSGSLNGISMNLAIGTC